MVSKPTHSGGIVFKFENNELKFLIITAKKNDKHWVFPKGHIEKNEDHEQAAIREVKEESGVIARLITPVGYLCFESEKDEIRVNTKFYLMEYISDIDSYENRNIRWDTFEEAIKKLPFEDSRTLLKQANQIIKKLNKKK